MRAAQYPPINEGEPIGFFSQALKDVLNRVQYGKPALTERQASFVGQLAQLLAVLSWQFARDWGRLAGVATAALHRAGPERALGPVESDRRAGLAGLALLGTLVARARLLHELQVRLLAVPRPAVAAARGARARLLLHRLLRRVRRVRGLRPGRAHAGDRRRAPRPRHRHGAVGRGEPGARLAFIPLFGNHVTASRAHETMARDFAYDMLTAWSRTAS